MSFLPKRKRGRQSAAAEARYRGGVEAFCDLIKQIKPTLDIEVGSRGWCYILEEHGLRKGDFDDAQRLINDCRKSGDLPIDICAEDGARETVGLEELNSNDVEEEVESWVDWLRDRAHENYTPISFWDDLDVYVEMAVEKVDLRNLFAPVCEEFHVPLTNFKGWADINSRYAIMRRFKVHRRKQCVLLLCGDHDPAGLHITNKIYKNLGDLSGAADWDPENLIIRRFGLNAEFIDDNNLTWIDNLETSKGLDLADEDHDDHEFDYVQDYLAMMTERYGEGLSKRKCEANALVVRPEMGRQLCRDAILEHVSAGAVQRHERRLTRVRNQLRKALRDRVS